MKPINQLKPMIMISTAVAVVGGGALLLPKFLKGLGLHPNYQGEIYDLSGKKAMIITTSHDTLGEGGKKTGVYASEMTIPYYEFLDAGMAVHIASIEGGEVPIENHSLHYPLATRADKRYLNDGLFLNKTKTSHKIDDVNFSDYDLIFMSGGWGAAYDLGTSEVLGEKITQANAEGKIIGSVCHGSLGFLKAKDGNGEPLVKGRKVTAVSDKQVKELDVANTPMHPETELRKLGADYQSKSAFKDMFANLTVVDGNIVTGQNQNAGKETAQKMMQLLSKQ